MNILSINGALTVCSLLLPGMAAEASAQTRLVRPVTQTVADIESDISEVDSIADERSRVREVYEILESLPPLDPEAVRPVSVVLGPKVFSGYHDLGEKHFRPHPLDRNFYAGVAYDVAEAKALAQLDEALTAGEVLEIDTEPTVAGRQEIPQVMTSDITPAWWRAALISNAIQQDFMYSLMIDDYRTIDYAYWDLPVPPRLPEDDASFSTYIKNMNLPEVDSSKAQLVGTEIEKRHWLHVFNTGLQFSQAYLSSNWYQGGSNNISLFVNFLWDVTLNPVWHPNFLLQSTLSYKLGLNSADQDTEHKYSISEDLLQYNFKMGLKAMNNWYYSLTAQFKTQLLNNYEANSTTLKAAFLSSGELNVGLGMTYSKANKANTVNFTASLAPVSYNLKMCINPNVDHGQFGIEQDRKTVSEIGSSAELNLKATIAKNIFYTSRLFLFSDYKYFLGDWENTLSFQFNKYLSTQIYAHLRFDSSSDVYVSKWRHWMLKEILSFGLTYRFSTKQ